MLETIIPIWNTFIEEMNIVLVVCLLFLVLCIYRSYQRGLLHSLFSMFSWILVLIIALVAAPVISSVLQEHTPVFTTVQERVLTYIEETVEEEDTAQESGTVVPSGESTTAQEELSQQLLEAGIEVPEYILVRMADTLSEQGKELLLGSSIPVRLSVSVAGLIIQLISILIAFILASILIQILVSALDIVAHLPILNITNHMLGGGFGVLRWFFYMYLFLFILSLIRSTAWSSFLLYNIENNSLLLRLYENNLLVNLFERLFDFVI
ncbi:MAG: CvpA family protein [Lachnospiraceae bacterium]